MYEMILAFITALTLTYVAIPSIITVAAVKKLYDVPVGRSSHKIPTPSLGGIGIFAGLIFAIVMWTPFYVFGNLQYILCSFLIIFLIGIKDDLLAIAPRTKLVAQLLAAAILVFKSEIKITSLYGLFGITEISDWFAIPLSIFTIVVIVNAFNLIDGINGLSGSISVLICTVLGSWFFLTENTELAILAAAAAGAVVGFLRYNAIKEAKIFMGDTGSLTLGLVASILVIKFIELHKVLPIESPYAFQSVPAVAIGILILPLFDTLRVFTTRMLKGRSPFSPDRTHIHHLLIDSGFTHLQATSILLLTNIFFIVLVFSLQQIGTLNLLLVVLFLAASSSGWLYFNVMKKKKLKESM